MERGDGGPEGVPGRSFGPTRRRFLAAAAAAGLAVVLGDDGGVAPAAAATAGGAPRPRALVYRGPASLPGIPEDTATMLRRSPLGFEVTFCGPRDRPVDGATLSTAALYVQPGGGQDLDGAWKAVAPSAGALRAFVAGGGRYLGICMGGYLAGHDPGLGLLAGDSGDYTATRGATVRGDRDSVVEVDWRGQRRAMYYQDGPYFTLAQGAKAEVLARYSNGRIAAMVTTFGRGRVGVCGPHPEADESWYRSAHLRPPSRLALDLGDELIGATMAAPRDTRGSDQVS